MVPLPNPWKIKWSLGKYSEITFELGLPHASIYSCPIWYIANSQGVPRNLCISDHSIGYGIQPTNDGTFSVKYSSTGAYVIMYFLHVNLYWHHTVLPFIHIHKTETFWCRYFFINLYYGYFTLIRIVYVKTIRLRHISLCSLQSMVCCISKWPEFHLNILFTNVTNILASVNPYPVRIRLSQQFSSVRSG